MARASRVLPRWKKHVGSARPGAWNKIKIYEFEQKSFTKDFILVCSIGLNIGFFIGLLRYIMKKYVKVDCVSTFRQTYMIPWDGLQETNPDVELNDKLAEEWASDTVVSEECNEFSQKYLGEQISSINIITEDEMIEAFDKDNPLLISEWSREKKIDFVSKWNNIPKKPSNE